VNLRGLPEISSIGGNEALEGPGPWEAASPSGRGSGAALSVELATSSPVGAVGMAEGAPGAVVALVAAGAAGAASVVSNRPPMLGGSVVLGTGVAPSMGGASADARFSSSPAMHGIVIGRVVEAESGPSVVWLVFLC
jgi:hypothetical protein